MHAKDNPMRSSSATRSRVMKYARIPQVGKRISRIVQGCTMLRDGGGQRRSNDLLDEVFEAGINPLGAVLSRAGEARVGG